MAHPKKVVGNNNDITKHIHDTHTRSWYLENIQYKTCTLYMYNKDKRLIFWFNGGVLNHNNSTFPLDSTTKLFLQLQQVKGQIQIPSFLFTKERVWGIFPFLQVL